MWRYHTEFAGAHQMGTSATHTKVDIGTWRAVFIVGTTSFSGVNSLIQTSFNTRFLEVDQN